MMRLATRIAKLEAIKGARSHLRLVQRHVIAGTNEAERGKRISDILANATGNALHVLRVVIDPVETKGTAP